MLCHVYRTVSSLGGAYYVLIDENDSHVTVNARVVPTLADNFKFNFSGNVKDKLFFDTDKSIDLVDTVKTDDVLEYIKFHVAVAGVK